MSDTLPTAPQTARELYVALVHTGVVALVDSDPRLIEGFSERHHAGASAAELIEWLCSAEAVDDVFITDEGLQAALDTLPR